MKLDIPIDGNERKCRMQELLPFPSLQEQVFPKHISESIIGTRMQFDILREGNEKNIVQELNSFHNKLP